MVYEKNTLPSKNASFMAGGMLAPYSEIEHMPPEWVQAGLNGIEYWRAILGQESAQAEFSCKGSLLIAHKEDQYVLERFKTHLSANTNCQNVSKAEVAQLEPQIAERFDNGVFLKEEAHLHPQKTMQLIIDRGAFEMRQEEAAPSALSEQYDHVIDCRGYDAEKQTPGLRGVKGEIAIVRNTEFYLERPVRLMHPRYPLYIVPRKGNIFMIGATVIEAANNEHVSVRSSLELLSALYSLHPSFGDAQILDMSAGIRPAYADNLPRITLQDNIVRCNGLFRHGYLLAPVMAQCVEHMIHNKHHDLTALLMGENHEYKNQRKSAEL